MAPLGHHRAEKVLVLTFLLVNQVNQVSTFISIRLIIWFDWKPHHLTKWFSKHYRTYYPASHMLPDFSFAEEPEREIKFEKEQIYFDFFHP